MTPEGLEEGSRLSRRAALRLGAAVAFGGPLVAEAIRLGLGNEAQAQAMTTSLTTALPHDVGLWSAPIPGPEPVIAVHASLLHTGEVLMVEGTTAYVWDPETGEHQRVDPPDDLFCSGHTILADGDVLFVGGHIPPEENQGAVWNYTFRPSTGTWTRRQDSRKGRWYPSATLLPDGRCVITGGTDQVKHFNDDIDVYENGTLTNQGEHNLEFYPLQHVLPDAGVLAVAPDQVGSTYLLDTSAFSFRAVGTMGMERGYPACVLLPGGPQGSTRVMVIGGWTHSRIPHDSTQVFDAATPDVGWQRRAPMPQPRVFTNVVILPDGTLLAIGGTSDRRQGGGAGHTDHTGAGGDGPQRQALLYDPLADMWRGLSSQTEARSYHSTALLLPDGRVLSAGDNLVPPGGGDKLEIFSPPYLFRGPRPSITWAPEEVDVEADFVVRTDLDVARAVLMRPGSTTHSFDMSQRHVELAFTRVTDGIRATLPAGAVAIAGWYMLFVLSPVGVPSIARWIRVKR
jgi:hypothetical protein